MRLTIIWVIYYLPFETSAGSSIDPLPCELIWVPFDPSASIFHQSISLLDDQAIRVDNAILRRNILRFKLHGKWILTSLDHPYAVHNKFIAVKGRPYDIREFQILTNPNFCKTTWVSKFGSSIQNTCHFVPISDRKGNIYIGRTENSEGGNYTACFTKIDVKNYNADSQNCNQILQSYTDAVQFIVDEFVPMGSTESYQVQPGEISEIFNKAESQMTRRVTFSSKSFLSNSTIRGTNNAFMLSFEPCSGDDCTTGQIPIILLIPFPTTYLVFEIRIYLKFQASLTFGITHTTTDSITTTITSTMDITVQPKTMVQICPMLTTKTTITQYKIVGRVPVVKSTSHCFSDVVTSNLVRSNFTIQHQDEDFFHVEHVYDVGQEDAENLEIFVLPAHGFGASCPQMAAAFNGSVSYTKSQLQAVFRAFK